MNGSLLLNTFIAMKITLEQLCQERPIGSATNLAIAELIADYGKHLGYQTEELELDCNLWEQGHSWLMLQGLRRPIKPSPFSRRFSGESEVCLIHTLEELQQKDIRGKLVFLKGELAENPLMPKDFPFYYPEEHKSIIDLLEAKEPAAILALTGKHPMCGLMPFPLFEDGNMRIASAYAAEEKALERLAGKRTSMLIDSRIIAARAKQPIMSKPGNTPFRILVCAHMDSKYETPGAIDNAAGLAVMLQLMEELRDTALDMEFVPFNGEEYYGVSGQLAYLNHVQNYQKPIGLVINIDSPGHRHSTTACSLYNFDEDKKQKVLQQISDVPVLSEGMPWLAGDHAMFAFQGIPCMAFTSSNLYEVVLGITHTPDDIAENIDPEILHHTAKAIGKLITHWHTAKS